MNIPCEACKIGFVYEVSDSTPQYLVMRSQIQNGKDMIWHECAPLLTRPGLFPAGEISFGNIFALGKVGSSECQKPLNCSNLFMISKVALRVRGV